jgi:hypothetical protein
MEILTWRRRRACRASRPDGRCGSTFCRTRIRARDLQHQNKHTHSECQKLSRIIRGGGMNIQTHLALGARPKTRFTTRSRAATQKHEIPQQQHKRKKWPRKHQLKKVHTIWTRHKFESKRGRVLRPTSSVRPLKMPFPKWQKKIWVKNDRFFLGASGKSFVFCLRVRRRRIPVDVLLDTWRRRNSIQSVPEQLQKGPPLTLTLTQPEPERTHEYFKTLRTPTHP